MFSIALLAAVSVTATEFQKINMDGRWQKEFPDAVKCMDGSEPFFYLAQNEYATSTQWLIYLEDGPLCYDVASCDKLVQESPEKVGSSLWP